MPQYDVAVIGGGIHGAGVAQAAAAAGYSVVVLEQRALAAGTSSRSSKLIHGGLRYLESGQFTVVRECLRERALLLRLAPELVRLVDCHIPVYRETSRRPWKIQTGLALYALLAGLGPDGRFERLGRERWGQLDGLETRGLEAVFRYRDAQTDDALLTRAVMHSAQSLGAELLVPCEFLGAERAAGGYGVRYSDGREQSLEARVLINAAGPWVNHVLARVTPQPPRLAIELIQGAHLVLPGRLARGIYYLEAPRDRRAVFVIPWRDSVMVGTTETVFTGDPAEATPLTSEQDYLLETLRHYFPDYREVGRAQVTSAFAGLRVLPVGGDSPFGRSRETMLLTDPSDPPRLLSIYGGKLTAYRATAERVLSRILPSLPQRRRRSDTTELALALP